MLAALLLVPVQAAAQSVIGRVVEVGSGDPVVGAFVGMYDAAGARVAAGLTGASGDFVIRTPQPGTFRLGAARIGYRSAATDPIRVAAGEVASVVIEVPG